MQIVLTIQESSQWSMEPVKESKAEENGTLGAQELCSTEMILIVITHEVWGVSALWF